MQFLWLIIAMAVVIYVENFLFSHYALRNITYQCWFEQNAAFEGEKITFIERLINKKLLPVLWLKIRVQMPLSLKFYDAAFVNISDKQYYQRIFSLLGYQQVTCRHTLVCAQRGYYTVDEMDMISGDILSGRRSYKTIDLDLDFYVYPRLINVDDVLIPARLLQGDIIVRRWIAEDPFQVVGFRDYQPTDSLNKINWMATAKQQKLQVAKHDYTASSDLVLILNVEYKSAWVEYDVLEGGVRLCASLAQKAIDNGVPVAVASNGLLKGYSKPTHLETFLGCSREHMIGILEGLARLTFEYQESFSAFLADMALSIPYNADLLIFTSYFDEELASIVEEMDKSRVSVGVVALKDGDWKDSVPEGVELYTVLREDLIA